MKRREKRYAAEIPSESKTLQEDIRSSAHQLISDNIGKMKVTQNRPNHMDYFDKIADLFGEREKEVRAFKEAGGIIFGYSCVLVPLELIYAVDALPLRLCSGLYDTVRLGEEILPVDICPLVKSTLGVKVSGISPYFELSDILINPTTCDAKAKMGEIFEDYMPVWAVNVPNIKPTPRSKNFWIDEIKELKNKIEGFTGKKISEQRLRSAIETVLRAQKQFRRLYDIRKADTPTIMGRDAMLVNDTFFYDKIDRWTEKTKELCDELDEHLAKNQQVCATDTPRLMLAGSPIMWPNWKIPNIVEESGGIVVCDELCSSSSLYDTVNVSKWKMDDMIRALSERYLMPRTCACFVPNDERVDRMLKMIDEFKVDGVIYNVLRGCHSFNIESTWIKRVLERKNIPMYKIESEYNLEDIGQIKTRIEAFLEMLKARK